MVKCLDKGDGEMVMVKCLDNGNGDGEMSG